jgi:hypothetical protein
MDLGKCLVTALEVRPGQVRNWLLAMAAFHVEGTGLKAAAWRYLRRSALVEV